MTLGLTQKSCLLLWLLLLLLLQLLLCCKECGQHLVELGLPRIWACMVWCVTCRRWQTWLAHALHPCNGQSVHATMQTLPKDAWKEDKFLGLESWFWSCMMHTHLQCKGASAAPGSKPGICRSKTGITWKNGMWKIWCLPCQLNCYLKPLMHVLLMKSWCMMIMTLCVDSGMGYNLKLPDILHAWFMHGTHVGTGLQQGGSCCCHASGGSITLVSAALCQCMDCCCCCCCCWGHWWDRQLCQLGLQLCVRCQLRNLNLTSWECQEKCPMLERWMKNSGMIWGHVHAFMWRLLTQRLQSRGPCDRSGISVLLAGYNMSWLAEHG